MKTIILSALSICLAATCAAQNKKPDARQSTTTKTELKGDERSRQDVKPSGDTPAVRPVDVRTEKPVRENTNERTKPGTTATTTGSSGVKPKPIEDRDSNVGRGDDLPPVVQNVGNSGQINWTDNYVEARGKSAMDTSRFKVPGSAQLMAEEGARADAYRQLLETIQGVYVVGETSMKDFITQSDYVYKRVDGMVKGARPVGVPMVNGNIVEVVLRIPIYGSGGLSEAIPATEVENELKKKYGEKYPKSGEPGSQEPTIDGKPVVFTFKGKQYDPSMFPVIVDEDNGKVLFDFSKAINNGNVPKYLRATQKLLEDIGLTEGAEIVELVSNGRGEYTIPKEIQRKLGWMRAINIIGGVVKFVVDIVK